MVQDLFRQNRSENGFAWLMVSNHLALHASFITLEYPCHSTQILLHRAHAEPASLSSAIERLRQLVSLARGSLISPDHINTPY
jgi:hypothetical protein